MTDRETLLRMRLIGMWLAQVAEHELKMLSSGPVVDPPPLAETLKALLSPGQHKMLALKAKGHSTRVIAGRLGVSEKTVRNQLSAAYKRMGMTPFEAVIAYAKSHIQE